MWPARSPCNLRRGNWEIRRSRGPAPMFIGKAPTDTSTKPSVFRRPSVHVEFSFPLVRRQSDPSHSEPEWFSELSEVVDSLPDLIATFDRDGRLMMINTAGIDLLGYSEPSLRGLLISDLYPEPDARAYLRRRVATGTQPRKLGRLRGAKRRGGEAHRNLPALGCAPAAPRENPGVYARGATAQ